MGSSCTTSAKKIRDPEALITDLVYSNNFMEKPMLKALIVQDLTSDENEKFECVMCCSVVIEPVKCHRCKKITC